MAFVHNCFVTFAKPKTAAPDKKFQLALDAAVLLDSLLDFAMMTSTQIRQSFLDFFKSKQPPS